MKLKKGMGVFIQSTPGVVLEVNADKDAALVVYGNLAMQRLEQHWFSIKVLSASTK